MVDNDEIMETLSATEMLLRAILELIDTCSDINDLRERVKRIMKDS